MLRDPAAATRAEVAARTHPGLHAIWAYRLAHRLWRRPDPAAGAARARSRRPGLTGVEIHPGAHDRPALLHRPRHGRRHRRDRRGRRRRDALPRGHPGRPALRRRGTKRHPTVGDRVTIGAGAGCSAPSRSATTCRSARTRSSSRTSRRTRSWSASRDVQAALARDGRRRPRHPRLAHLRLAPDRRGTGRGWPGHSGVRRHPFVRVPASATRRRGRRAAPLRRPGSPTR